MAPSEQPPDLGILLAVGFQEFVRQLRAALAGQGFADLGRSDGYVFRTVAAAPMTVSALAQRLRISKQGAAQIVEDMERRGYLERHPDPRDGRARLLRLSVRGERALSAAHRFHQGFERRLSQRHGTEAVSTLRALLTMMAGDQDTLDPDLRAFYL